EFAQDKTLSSEEILEKTAKPYPGAIYTLKIDTKEKKQKITKYLAVNKLSPGQVEKLLRDIGRDDQKGCTQIMQAIAKSKKRCLDPKSLEKILLNNPDVENAKLAQALIISGENELERLFSAEEMPGHLAARIDNKEVKYDAKDKREM